ncbi:hypothetical protein TNCV_4196821 [Trichonephila clavipes]|nr:hypothetical protein TNCV_4196821 [Trichonephila clavipes]
MFDPSSFADPTPLPHADISRDVLPRGALSTRADFKKNGGRRIFRHRVTRTVGRTASSDFHPKRAGVEKWIKYHYYGVISAIGTGKGICK